MNPDLKLLPGEDFATYESRVSGLQGIKNLAPTIPVPPVAPLNGTTLSPQSQTPYTSPAPTVTPDVSKLDTLFTPSVPEQNASDLSNRIRNLNNELVGQSDYRAQQETAQGVPELQKIQTDLSAQLKAITNDAAAIRIQFNQGDSRGIATAILNTQQNKKLNDNAIQALSVSSLLAASQGNLALANSLVDKAVAAKYDSIKEQIDAATKNLKLVLDSPDYTLAEKKRAQEQLDTQNAKQEALDTAKQNSKEVYNIALEAAKNGADAVTLQKVQASKTSDEAIQNAGTFLAGKNNLDTSIVEVAGKKVLINNQTGQTIKILGSTSSGGAGGISGLTQAVIDNPSLFDDLTPTNRGVVIANLQANGYDTSNLGVKGLSDTAINQIAQTQKALSDLSDLKTIVENNQDKLGPITGLAALNPFSDAKKIQADVNRVKQTVGKALEGGVLRKEDEDKYKEILAKLTDTPSTALYKINSLIGTIQRDIENYKSLQQSSGRSLDVNASLQKKGAAGSSPEDLRKKYGY